MGFQPWCRIDPLTVAKCLGLIEIIISCTGLVCMICLSIITADVAREVRYIKRSHHGLTIGRFNNETYYETINITTISSSPSISCEALKDTIRDDLLHLKGRQKIHFDINIQRSEQTGGGNNSVGADPEETLCEIHVLTTLNSSRRKLEHEKHSILGVIENTLATLNNSSGNFQSDVTIIPPEFDHINQRLIYPDLHLIADQARQMCIIERLSVTDPLDVKYKYDLSMNLLAAAAILSILIGVLTLWVGHQITRCLLLQIFFLDWISVGLLISAVVILNNPSLCLLEHNGLSAAWTYSRLQTKITCICSLYLIFVKIYSIWFIMAFTEAAPRLQEQLKALNQIDPEAEKQFVADFVEELNAIQEELRRDHFIQAKLKKERKSIEEAKEREEAKDKEERRKSLEKDKLFSKPILRFQKNRVYNAPPPISSSDIQSLDEFAVGVEENKK